MNEKIEVSVTPGPDGLVMRTGSALPLKEPVRIEIVGDINTVANFLKGRTKSYGAQHVDKNVAIVLVDKQDMDITLYLHPNDHYGTKVVGTLEISEELKPFCINGTNTFTRESLVKILRFNKMLFDSSEEHAKLLAAYQAFSASTASNVSASADTRGNKEAAFKKEVTTNIPVEFILNVPIFKGQKKERFRVEICLDVTDASARFWFESVELHELTQTRLDEIFTEQLKACEGFVIINQ